VDRYERIRGLIPQSFEKLQKSKVLLLGVGGVGGVCLECLYRSGVKDITVVDFDTFDITNQNRQLGSEAVGEYKVYYYAKTKGVKAINEKISARWVQKFDFSAYDFVLDAIDDIEAKVAIAHRCASKLISATGSARKFDPTKIEVASIWKTSVDPLARKFRYELKKSGFRGDFLTVFSTEKTDQNIGSFMGVTGAFGLTLCALVVQKVKEG